MRVMYSQCMKHIRLFTRRCCGPSGYLTIKMTGASSMCPSGFLNLLARYSMSAWKMLAYSILPLLLVFYEFYGAYLFFFIIVSLAGVIYFAQDILLYNNDTPANSRLFVQGLESVSKVPPGGLQSVTFVTEDLVVLHGYLLKAENSIVAKIPTIVYFHGNAGNIGHRIPNAVEMVTKLECNVLLVEYRGFGKSTGTPSESGLYLDAKAAISFVRENTDLNPNKIILFGRSLGGAVAIHSASMKGLSDEDKGSFDNIPSPATGVDAMTFRAHPSGVVMLIVENTFTHIADVAEVMFQIPGFNYIPRMFYKNKFASCEKIGYVQMPSLFISGQADQLVPPHMMASLFSKCSASKKRLLKVRGGTHNETWMTSGYYESVKKFIDEVLGDKNGGGSTIVGGDQNASNASHIINSPLRSFPATVIRKDDTSSSQQNESNVRHV